MAGGMFRFVLDWQAVACSRNIYGWRWSFAAWRSLDWR
jgi:hypothetical protein